MAAAALLIALACAWEVRSLPLAGTAVGSASTRRVGSVHMMGRRAAARERGRVREAEKAADTDHCEVLKLRPRRSRTRDSIVSVELPRQNYAVVHYANGSAIERYTPDLNQRIDEDEWLAVRSALELTASEFAAAKDAWRHASRATVLARKLGKTEALFRGNAATAFGTQMEPRAVRLYERVTGYAVAPTGLHMHPNLRWGASPDGIVTTTEGDVGLLEVKCSFRLRHRGVVPQYESCPPEFMDQIQGQLAVTGLRWCDLFYYVPPKKASMGGRNYCCLRIHSDPSYFASLVPHLESFGAELKAARRIEAEQKKRQDKLESEGLEDKGLGEPGSLPSESAGWVASASLPRTVNRENARRGAHSDLLNLVVDLITEIRHVPEAHTFIEMPIGKLPVELGLGSTDTALLSPDAVIADTESAELLVVEVTIVPDEALGRYYGKKVKKYSTLSRAVRPRSNYEVLPTIVVAVGESGALHPYSAEALYGVLPGLTSERFGKFATLAASLARNRPGTARARRHHRQRKLPVAVMPVQ